MIKYNKIMKKILLITSAILVLSSCNRASELPPIDEGYASSFILPDPVDLTSSDREQIRAQEAEYKNAISQQ